MTRDEAGLHYVRSTASSSRGQIGGMYDFDQFVDALHHVCMQISSDCDDDDGDDAQEPDAKKSKQIWAQFLLEYVLPLDRAKRIPEFREDAYFSSRCGEIVQLRREFELCLRPIFEYVVISFSDLLTQST